MIKTKVLLLTLSLLVLPAIPSQAKWAVTGEDNNSVRDFAVSSEEVTNTPQVGQMYAVVEDGIIIKFVTWTLTMQEDLLVALPGSFSVKYIDISGVLRAEPINHGDRIYVQVTSSGIVVLNDSFGGSPVIDLPTFDGDAIVEMGTEILYKGINSDYSTSITFKPIENTDPGKVVAIQVVSNGLSWTSITTDNSNSPVTVSNLPEDSLVTVQTVVRDLVTNQEKIIQSEITRTADIDIPKIANSRNVEQDKVSIFAPKVTTRDNGTSATILFDQIADFDEIKSRAAIMVVGPGGSTTYIGIDGKGGTANVGDLDPNAKYVINLVIRDVDSGEEMVINAQKQIL